MGKTDKMAVKFTNPPVRFSESGAPYTLVRDIFESENGQRIISRMAERDTKSGRLKPSPDRK